MEILLKDKEGVDIEGNIIWAKSKASVPKAIWYLKKNDMINKTISFKKESQLGEKPCNEVM